MKAHSWSRKMDSRLRNPDVIDAIDECVPLLSGWEISQKDNDPLVRQIKVGTSNPGIKTVINIYSNGTVYASCSPKIHNNEFDTIVDAFKRLCEGIEEYLQNGKTDEKIKIPGLI